MKTSRTIHSFLLSEQEGQTLLTAQEYPLERATGDTHHSGRL